MRNNFSSLKARGKHELMNKITQLKFLKLFYFLHIKMFSWKYFSLNYKPDGFICSTMKRPKNSTEILIYLPYAADIENDSIFAIHGKYLLCLLCCRFRFFEVDTSICCWWFLVPSGDFVRLLGLTGRRRRLHRFSQTRSLTFSEFPHDCTWKFSPPPPGILPPYLVVFSVLFLLCLLFWML